MSLFGQKSKKNEKSKTDSFIWSDDEVELLLKVTLEYKTSDAIENVDWESIRSKYDDIFKRFIEQYPSSENALMMGKDYPHPNEELSKSVLTSKLKMVRKKFREAIDSGRKSGHGRVVLLYFELCEQIWGGSPATSTIADGIETAEIDDEHSLNPESPYYMLNGTISPELENENSPGDATSDANISTDNVSTSSSSSSRGQVKERRDLLNARLQGYKSEKLKRKMPVDAQLINISHEELQIKKQLLERMDNMDKAYSNQMEKLSSNMEKLTDSTSEGFVLLRQMMCPAPGVIQPQYIAPQANYSMFNYSKTQHASQLNTPAAHSGQFLNSQSLYSDNESSF